MVKTLRRGIGALSAWAALFAVAGVAYAARRRGGAVPQPHEPQSTGDEVSALAE